MAKDVGLDLYKHIVGPREMKSREAVTAAAAIAAAASTTAGEAAASGAEQ